MSSLIFKDYLQHYFSIILILRTFLLRIKNSYNNFVVSRSRKAYGNLILLKPYPHAAPYLIGMLTGYLLFINSKIKFSTTVKCLGWILSIVIALFEVFSTWQWNNGSVPGQLIASIYASLFRVFWAASLAWVVIACHYGFGGIFNNWICA